MCLITITSWTVYIGNQEDQRTSIGSRTETNSVGSTTGIYTVVSVSLANWSVKQISPQISPTSQTGLQKWLLCYLFIIATYTVHGKIWLGTFQQAIQVKAIGKENLANKP